VTIKTSAEARRNWRELLDLAQKSPVAITRKGVVVAYVISPKMMDELVKMRTKTSRR
jgi:prevent-host-death family protein